MSIRSVSCPGCGVALNVPATMTNIKCSACATIWNVANPGAAKKSAQARSQGARYQGARSQSDGDNENDEPDSGESINSTMLIASVGGILALLVLLGVGVAIMSGSTKKSKPASSEAPVKTQPYQKVKVEYRVVKLPESQRKKIYYDFRLTAGSTIEQKVFLPGASNKKGGSKFASTMGGIAKREATHLALIHNVEEEDIYNIVLEGDDKEWPPRKAPTLAP